MMDGALQKTVPLSRTCWAQIVARHRTAVAERHVKRRHPRYPCGAGAALAYTRQTGLAEVPQIQRCAVLEISVEGLTLRSQRRLPLHAFVAVRLELDRRPLLLWGQVVHCTQTVGAFKVGLKLRFPEEGAEGRAPPD